MDNIRSSSSHVIISESKLRYLYSEMVQLRSHILYAKKHSECIRKRSSRNIKKKREDAMIEAIKVTEMILMDRDTRAFLYKYNI